MRLYKKRPIPKNRDGDVFKHEKNPQSKDSLCSQKGSVLKTDLIIYLVFRKAAFRINKQIEDSFLE